MLLGQEEGLVEGLARPLGVAILASPAGIRQAGLMGLPARGIFCSAATSPGSLAMTLPFINNKSEWNTEARSQKTLLLSLEEVETKQWRERKGKQAPRVDQDVSLALNLDISTL